MTIQPRRSLRPMKKGNVLRARDLDNLRAMLAQMQNTGAGAGSPPELVVILDEDLDAAESSLTPTMVEATVCVWNPDAGENGEYEQTERTEDVFNHSEATEHEQDTFGVARWIDGHYWFFGDCEPMSERPTPPGAD